MDSKNQKSPANELLEIIKPELLKILGNAPSYGSCGMDLVFHNNEIVRIGIRTEITKIHSVKSSQAFHD